MVNIDFFTFVYKDTYKYAEFLKYTCDLLCSNDLNIHYKCIESVDVDKIPDGFECVAKTSDCGHNSYNHSIAMNEALKHIKSEYVVFADCDIAILHKNWDKIIVKELQNDTSCFGFSYHSKSPRYKDFPNVFLFCFRSDMIDKVDLDFRPEVKAGRDAPLRYSLTDTVEAKYMNRPLGFQIKCDTGWKLPTIIKSGGLRGKSMKCVQGNSKKSLLPFRDKKQRKFCLQKPTHMAEWHYNGKLFGTHKQACRSHGLDSKWGRAWKDRIMLYLKGIKNYE